MKALQKKEEGVKDLNVVLLKTKNEFAKKELQKVLKKSETRILDLKAHIKEGIKVLAERKTVITKIEQAEKPVEKSQPK